MQLEALKPCPFCGGEAEVIFVTGMSFDWWARCFNPDCRASIRLRANTSKNDDPVRANAIERWNSRTPSPEPTEAEVEAACEAFVARSPDGRPLTFENHMRNALRAASRSRPAEANPAPWVKEWDGEVARPAEAKAGMEETSCPECGRHVMADPQPATGFVAKCGRRLTRLSECSATGCSTPALEPVAEAKAEPVGLDGRDLSILDSYKRMLEAWSADESTPAVLREELTRFITWFGPIRSALASPTPPALTDRAAADVLAERQRQISAEGWTPEHDDEHTDSQLARAAAAYTIFAGSPARFTELARSMRDFIPTLWPWEAGWWKPSPDPRRNLVKAGALILAEIARLDRRALKESE